MCKGVKVPSWEEIKVKRGQQVVLEIQGKKEKETAKTKDEFGTLMRQRLATKVILNWYVEAIPVEV